MITNSQLLRRHISPPFNYLILKIPASFVWYSPKTISGLLPGLPICTPPKFKLRLLSVIYRRLSTADTNPQRMCSHQMRMKTGDAATVVLPMTDLLGLTGILNCRVGCRGPRAQFALRVAGLAGTGTLPGPE